MNFIDRAIDVAADNTAKYMTNGIETRTPDSELTIELLGYRLTTIRMVRNGKSLYKVSVDNISENLSENIAGNITENAAQFRSVVHCIVTALYNCVPAA